MKLSFELHLQKKETQSSKIKKKNKRANIQTKRQQQTVNTKTSSYIKREKKENLQNKVKQFQSQTDGS